MAKNRETKSFDINNDPTLSARAAIVRAKEKVKRANELAKIIEEQKLKQLTELEEDLPLFDKMLDSVNSEIEYALANNNNPSKPKRDRSQLVERKQGLLKFKAELIAEKMELEKELGLDSKLDQQLANTIDLSTYQVKTNLQLTDEQVDQMRAEINILHPDGQPSEG